MNARAFHTPHETEGWCPQEGPQADYCACPHAEVFLGGARGGGKTSGVLGKWALKERRYGPAFNAIMLRPTTVGAEDAIEESKLIYSPLGGVYNETKHRWRMPNGGRVAFAYLESVDDAQAYQGRNVTDAWVEEAGLYPLSDPIDRLFGILRSSRGVPIQLTLTANPGGPGQGWISERYGLIPFPQRPKVLVRTLPNGSVHRVAVIPSRLRDNKILLSSDPKYIDRLYLVGSPALVRAWLEGDWSAIEGAFFSEWSEQHHVIAPFAIPDDWLRFRSADWGSASPFSIGWWAVVGDNYALGQMDSGIESTERIQLGAGPLRGPSGMDHAGGSPRTLPRGAIIRYREWYGASKPNVGLNLFAEEVAKGIIQRERADPKLGYAVLDPSAFAEDGGPSIAERLNNELQRAKIAAFHKADNKRVTRSIGEREKSGPMGGWDQMRARLVGTGKRQDDGSIDWSHGAPMMFFFSTCRDTIRTIPAMQHDKVRSEDLDTKAEDHAVDDVRYGCVSRPWVKEKPVPLKPKDSYRPAAEVVADSDSILLL
jgi:hypothetical protein